MSSLWLLSASWFWLLRLQLARQLSLRRRNGPLLRFPKKKLLRHWY
jgi:hypothetical protein